MNKKDTIILAIVGVVLAAGAVLASTGVISFGEQPQVLLKKMSDARTQVRSSHFDVTVNADITGATPSESGAFSARLVGDAAKHETEQKAQLEFSVKGTEGSSTEALDVAGELRVLDRVVYLKTTKLPAIPFIPAGKILNTWFSIDPVALAKEFGGNDSALELESALGASTKMPPAFYEKVYGLVAEEKVISSILPKGGEVVSGVATDKYDVKVDFKKLPSFLEKYTDVYNQYATKAGLATMPHKTFSDEERAALESIDMTPISLWVGKADSLVYKVVFMVTFDDSSDRGQDIAGTAGTLSFAAVMSDYNKEVTVDVPKPATPIQELFKTLMGGAILE